MQQHPLLFISCGVLICGLSGAPALAGAPLALTATSITMPSSGNGSSEFTLSGIPGNGTVVIGCVYSGPISTLSTDKIPFCVSGASGAAVPVQEIPVTAGETLTGTVTFYPFGTVIPLAMNRAPSRSGPLPAAGLALAGALMLGFGLRRGRRRWLALAVIAVGALAGVSAISGCGGLSNAMTPGSYQYTITAAYQDTGTPVLSAILNTNVEVTVP